MAEREVMMDRMTRREFREGIEGGDFQTVIIPTGANEQHLEHLTTGHDIRHSTHIAREAALNLHPQVAVTVPMNIGISEHHMVHKGTVTAKPGSWLSLLFDAAESVIRHGVQLHDGRGVECAYVVETGNIGWGVPRARIDENLLA